MLAVRSLTRTFGERVALDDVSFDVAPGRVTGFVGANGAGKTTTMRIVMGVLAPDSGEVRWQDGPVTDEVRRSFGYLPEERGLYPRMRVLDQLVFFARLHGVDRATAESHARELLDGLELGARAGDLLEALSLGNQQRVQIAAALVHRPAALVLDEPFSGLDPLAVEQMIGLVREQVSARVPLLFSSHQLELVERICDDLVVLAQGRLVAAGAADELRRRGPVRYRLELGASPRDLDVPGALADLRGVRLVEADADVATLERDDGVAADDAALLAALVARVPVRSFGRVVRPLAEVFREVIR